MFIPVRLREKCDEGRLEKSNINFARRHNIPVDWTGGEPIEVTISDWLNTPPIDHTTAELCEEYERMRADALGIPCLGQIDITETHVGYWAD